MPDDRPPCTLDNCGHMRQLDAIVTLLGMTRGTRSVLDELRSRIGSEHVAGLELAVLKADELTLYQAQREQPWTMPYGEGKWWVTNNEGRLKHCLAHAQKSLGKIAAIIEKLDHENHQWLSDAESDAVGDMAADLVSVALQIGTVVSRSVAHALVRRVSEKNGAALDPKGGSHGRTLICK